MLEHFALQTTSNSVLAELSHGSEQWETTAGEVLPSAARSGSLSVEHTGWGHTVGNFTRENKSVALTDPFLTR